MPSPTTPWLEAGLHAADLADVDPEVSGFVRREFVRQRDQMELIAPKTFASPAAIPVMGSIMANRVVEGHPGHRYHAGAAHLDATRTWRSNAPSRCSDVVTRTFRWTPAARPTRSPRLRLALRGLYFLKRV